MVLTERDRKLVEWVYRARLATREQVQRLFFSGGGRSLCQRRLTLLYRTGYLDRLPRQAVSVPHVYYVSRRAVRGLRFMRALCPDETVAPQRANAHTVQHSLEITCCHVSFLLGCKAAGYELPTWLAEADLAPRMREASFLPDAWFQVERPTSEGPRRASFFLEVERSGKSQHALEEKFRRLGAFYYGGAYERLFGTRALRVLVLVGSDYGIKPQRHIAKLAAICDRLGVTVVRLADLEELKHLPPPAWLTAPVWFSPGRSEPLPLFGPKSL